MYGHSLWSANQLPAQGIKRQKHKFHESSIHLQLTSRWMNNWQRLNFTALPFPLKLTFSIVTFQTFERRTEGNLPWRKKNFSCVRGYSRRPLGRVYQQILANDNILRAFRRLETRGIIVCTARESRECRTKYAGLEGARTSKRGRRGFLSFSFSLSLSLSLSLFGVSAMARLFRNSRGTLPIYSAPLCFFL